jgi:hypothetical protein
MLIHFHLNDRGRLVPDDEGAEFETIDDAREEALAAAREMMAERIILGRPLFNVSFMLTTETGDLLTTVRWEDALVVETGDLEPKPYPEGDAA